MTIIKEFFEFFNVVVQGREIEVQPPCAINRGTFINEAHRKVSSTLTKITQRGDVKAWTGQKVSIKCGGKNTKLKAWQLQPRNQLYNPVTGKDVKGTGCVSYGCCYDVHQKSKIDIKVINKATTSEINQMNTDIKNVIVSKLSVAGNCIKDTFSDVSVGSESSVFNIVKNIIDKHHEITTSASQEITLEYNQPLLCVNKCGERPTAGYINQISNIDVIATDIVDQVSEKIVDIARENSRRDKGLLFKSVKTIEG